LPILKGSSGALTPAQAAGGHDVWAFEPVPRQLDLLPRADDFFVVGVACGLHSSFFLGDDGRVLFTGSVVGDPSPFGRPCTHDPKVPFKLEHLPRIREISVSLNVPLKLPGMPFYVLPPLSESRPGEAIIFQAADAPRTFVWSSPGGPLPKEWHV
jgi:hypothetical protein